MPTRPSAWWRGWHEISRASTEACPIGSDRALDTALITAPDARDPALLKKLDAVAGRVLART